MYRIDDQKVAWRQVEGEIVLLQLEKGMYLSVNRVGAFLWSQLLDGATFEQLIGSLQAEFDVAGEVLESDVRAFLAELEAHGLLITQ